MTDKELQTNLNYYADYFEALFWADVDANDDIKCEYDLLDVDRDSLIKSIKELDQFFEKADSILENTDYTHGQACHDFYFTRCGHGVGFWENDHCDEKAGELLTEIAQEFGPVYIYENDAKNKLYIDQIIKQCILNIEH